MPVISSSPVSASTTAPRNGRLSFWPRNNQEKSAVKKTWKFPSSVASPGPTRWMLRCQHMKSTPSATPPAARTSRIRPGIRQARPARRSQSSSASPEKSIR